MTVEASSDTLIEKVRTATTDGSGQYRIIDLRAGIYRLTFRLAGFQTTVQESIELTGSATLSIHAEMRVGSVQETITVEAVSPVVDVQSARHEFVVTGNTISTLPISRGYGALLTTIPALMTSGTAEVVSAQTTPQMTFFTAHGGNWTEGRVTVDGMVVAAAFGGGGVSTLTYDIANANEVNITVAGGLGETETGGPSINIVPRSGGNTFRGSAFASGSGDRFRSDNVTPELRAIGIQHGPGSPSSGRQRIARRSHQARPLLVLRHVRNYSNTRAVEGVVANAVAGDASRWDYVRDDNVVARGADSRTIYSGRLTSQITQRQQVASCTAARAEVRWIGSAGKHDRRLPRTTSGLGGPWHEGYLRQFLAGSPPASMDTWYKTTQATWSMPRSNRLLFDAGFSRLAHIPGIGNKPPDTALNLIPVQEQANIYGVVANWTYRGISTYSEPSHRPTTGEPERPTSRRQQREGRIPGRLLSVRHTDPRQRHAAELPVQQPDPEPRHVPYCAMGNGQSHNDALDLRPGSVDEVPAHAGRRSPLRPGVELVSGGAQRCAGPDDLQLPTDHVRADRRRHRVSRSHASHERGLRSLRQRQDRHQVERWQHSTRPRTTGSSTTTTLRIASSLTRSVTGRMATTTEWSIAI